jgi:AcrR family transcriptional regulator
MPKKPANTAKKRVRRSPQAARQLILDAAMRVLAERGPSAVGLKEVAQAAGVSHALVTHYFGTYEALVSATVVEAMTTLRSRLIARILTTPDPTPEALVQLYLDIALEPSHGRLVSWALFSDHEGTANYAQRLVPDMKLIAAATEYMLAGRLKRPPTRRQSEALIITVWSMVVGYVAGRGFFWRAFGRKPSARHDAELRDAVGALARAMFK